MTIAIVNYGMGNLGSVSRAILKLGHAVEVADAPEQLRRAARIVLPGVGGFADGIRLLREKGWFEALDEQVRSGKPLFGICLGMQMLASSGSEFGEHAGLGFIPGHVSRLDALGCRERIPHVGWNDVRQSGDGDALFEGVPEGADFYFVHSFAFVPDDPAHVVGTVGYGVRFPAVVRAGVVMGTQFHPEKSSRAGLRVLDNFCRLPAC